MRSRQQFRQFWLFEYGTALLLISLYYFYQYGVRRGMILTLIAAFFFLPVPLSFLLGNRVSENLEQSVNILFLVVYLFVILNFIHNYSIISVVYMAGGVLVSPIFTRKSILIYSITASFFLLFSCVLVYFDPTLCPELSLRYFYLLAFITETCLSTFIIVARYSESTRLELERRTMKMAEDEKNALLSALSHEFRTPMNAILGLSEMLLVSDVNEKQRESLSTIHSSTQGLLNVVTELMDFSKIEDGNLELIETEYTVDDLLASVSYEVEARIHNKSISYYVIPNPNTPSVLCGDSHRVKQILLNIFDNAIKFTKRGKISFVVDYEKIGNGKVKLHFVIEDSGIGIPEQDLNNICNAFTHGDEKRNKNLAGLGLGLTIAEKLTLAMGGTLEINSEYGKGTKVSITIVQGVVNSKPYAALENPEKYMIYFCEPNRYYIEALSRNCQALGLEIKQIRDLSKIPSVMEDEENTFLFFNYPQYGEDIKPFIPQYKNAKFVGFLGRYDESLYEGFANCYFLNSFEFHGFIDVLTGRAKPKGEQSKDLKVEQELENSALNSALNSAEEDQSTNMDTENLNRNLDIHVLLVDDNEVNLKVAKGMLETYGVQVEQVSSGMDCIHRIENGEKYDLIFMDYMMPQMDGAQTTNIIRKMEARNGGHQIIVALTANTVAGTKEMLIESGMDDYMTKPLNLEGLDIMLSKWLGEDKRAMIISNVEHHKVVVNDRAKEEENQSIQKHIDVEAGIELIGGSEEIYKEILEIIAEEGIEKMALIRKLYEEKDYHNYEVEVHALKSSMAGIGVMDLSEEAKRHEYAVKENRLNYIDENLDKLLQLYKEVWEEAKEISAS